MSGLTIDDNKYRDLRTTLKQKGINIEDGEGKLDMRSNFNDHMKAKDKEEVAASFDSELDLKLQDELSSIMKKCGVNRYIDLLRNDKCAKMLKDAGIVVQALKDDGSINSDPKASTRNWQISKVDPKTGKVIKDQNNKLEQFKLKDFNSDSYIQGAELYVNELLSAAGYDCVSRAKGNYVHATEDGASGVDIGASSSVSGNSDLSSHRKDDEDYFKLDDMYETKDEAEKIEDDKKLVTNNEFEELVKQEYATQIETRAVKIQFEAKNNGKPISDDEAKKLAEKEFTMDMAKESISKGYYIS